MNIKEKIKEAKKRSTIMDKMSREGQHTKAKRAFDKLHSIYEWMIANGHDPKEYKI